MDLFSVLTLLYFVTAVCAEFSDQIKQSSGTHSLWYFVTITTGPSPFPEIVMVGMVDDVPVEYYDSIDRMVTPRQHWHKDNEVYAKWKRVAITRTSHSLKNRFQHMMEHFNHSVRLHTYQRIAGCELDDDGTERFQAKDSYNGMDVLIFDVQASAWSSGVPEIWKDFWLIESKKGIFDQFYQTACIYILKSYLHHERSILKRRVSPRIRVLRKQVGGAGGVEVTCLATGFYPRHIELTLKRDNQPVPEQELIRGDILPNGDGTYQLRMSLSVSAEELREGHRYTCSVRHVSMDNKLDIAWDSQPKPDIALISGASVTTLTAVLLILTGIFVLKKRKSKVPGCSRSGKIEEDMERMNAAEGVVKDAEEHWEKERQ
ncbi:major histocompatibility complex class I-related gene protein-like isoform X1 [Anguilla anguilla]|uniref:major histocompatibility complex class I-related gene protein-like isoform X1 n=1 Tax=Anguilla anguilla TaxID=7936 RepID=UPI0015A7AD36|nr:major histocompatibility complex class I-related gene protein-like isoform X1 [Anguilla anguilla]